MKGFFMKKYNPLYFLTILELVLFGCATITTESIIFTNSETQPSWMDGGVEEKDGFLFIVGHSQPRNSEQEARKDAFADAIKSFVKYCKVDVEAFDRSVGVLSETDTGKSESSIYENKEILRSQAMVRRSSADGWYIKRIGKFEGDRKVSEYFLASVRIKVPKEEYDRIISEKNVKLSIDMGLYHQKEDKLEQISQSDVLRSGDAYTLYLKPSDNCYIYVFQVDDSGSITKLFPNESFFTAKNPVSGGSEVWVPNSDKLLVLDDNTGKEKIYIFASFSPISNLEGKVELEQNDLGRMIKTMGVAGLKEKTASHKVRPPKKEGIVEVKQKLQAEGAFVYETWFWHR